MTLETTRRPPTLIGRSSLRGEPQPTARGAASTSYACPAQIGGGHQPLMKRLARSAKDIGACGQVARAAKPHDVAQEEPRMPTRHGSSEREEDVKPSPIASPRSARTSPPLMAPSSPSSSSSPSSHVAHSVCTVCRDERPPRRVSRVLAWMILPLAWAAILLTGSALAILVPANLVLIPCWIVVGSSLGPLTRELLDPKCRGCASPRGEATSLGEAASEGPRGFSSTGPAHLAWRSPRPAHKRTVKGGLVRES